MKDLAKSDDSQIVCQSADYLFTELHLTGRIKCFTSCKGIGKVHAEVVLQFKGIFVNRYCAFHCRIVSKLIGGSLDVLIQRHQRYNIHGKDKNKSHDHYCNGNVNIGFAFFVCQ